MLAALKLARAALNLPNPEQYPVRALMVLILTAQQECDLAQSCIDSFLPLVSAHEQALLLRIKSSMFLAEGRLI